MQKLLYFEVPEEQPAFHDQKELYDCTDEEFINETIIHRIKKELSQ